MDLSEADVANAFHTLKDKNLVRDASASRVPRFEHNFQRGLGVPEQSAVLLGVLMLRGPQTAAELRLTLSAGTNLPTCRRLRFFWTSCKTALPTKAVRWSSNCPKRRARAGSVGRICCVDRWMLHHWHRPIFQAVSHAMPSNALRG